MKLLAFDTSSTACSAALLVNGQHQEEHIKALHKNAPRQQAQLILEMTQSLVTSAGLTFSELDAIAFGCGPGSFTGIRIASCVAQGIGFTAGLPIVQISSLAALAQAAYDQYRWTTLVTALDAHMGQVYLAIYKANQDGLVDILGEETVFPISAIAVPDHWIYTTDRRNAIGWDIPKVDARISNGSAESIAGIGDGWLNHEAALINKLGFKPNHIEPSVLPTATAILKLAKAKMVTKDWIGAREVKPSYL